jgi:hypothetical protein
MKDPAARAAALKAAGLDGRAFFAPRQVHGTGIVRVEASTDPASVGEADGLVTAAQGPVLSVQTADCIPLFVWDRAGRAAGVFHAGWRGTAKGMARAAIKAFKDEFGIEARDLAAQLGPHILKCCFRVGPDTAEQFRPEVRLIKDDGVFIDLSKETVLQLIESGVRTTTPATKCTCSLPEEFFSFRRDKSDGRMMAFITLVPVETPAK